MDDTEAENRLTIEFWGVRGSIPTAEEDKLNVGGNTPCVAVWYGREPPVIIDGGTGLRLLGSHLASRDSVPLKASLFFSHFHWDHIQGLPFFEPLYSEHTELNLYSGVGAETFKEILEGQMSRPYFPVPMSAARARCEYGHVSREGCRVGSLKLHPVHLHHPGDATGYRIDSPAGSLIYISDHEHGVARIDDAIVEQAAGADLAIYDSHFTPDEYPHFRHWGHSTWLEATRLANRAKVNQLVLFHHKPSRTDEELSVILEEAQREFAGTLLARENRPIVVSNGR